MCLSLFYHELAIFIALLGVIGVFWSIKNKQFDDLEYQSEKILYEDLEETSDKKVNFNLKRYRFPYQ